MILIGLISVIFVLIYALSYKQRRIIKQIKKFNGPSSIPFIGSVQEVLCTPQELVIKLIGYSKIFVNPVSASLFWIPLVGISSPDDISSLSSKFLEKHYIFRCLADLIGDGLITAKVEKWKRSRRIVCSAFNLSILSQPFLDIFNQQNEKLISRLKIEVERGIQFDLWPYIFRSSYDTISETSMGHCDEIDDEEFSRTREAFHKASYLISKRIYQPWLLPSIIFKLYMWLIGCSHLIPQCQNLTLKILKERRKKFQNRLLNDEENKVGEEKRFNNLMDVLLNMKEKENCFTDQEIKDEMLTIQFAGSETTAITICFTLLQLGIRQDIQEKVYEELMHIFGASDRQPTLEDLHALKYLDQCVKETLRRYPVAPLSMRKSTQDITLHNGELIPAGVNIILGFAVVNISNSIYKSAETWDPENFDSEKVASRPQNHFLPFGAGPRTCIGNKYAMIAAKAQLSTILRMFKITTTVKESDIILTVDILLRSANGYPVKLEPRN